MILKELDDKGPAIAELEGLLASAAPGTRPKIDQELRTLRAGVKGEQESAYLIDFEFKDWKNWIVIHDLRLEHRGRVAQIDHVLMSRLLECYVLETKHFASGMKITEDGEFLRWNDFKKNYEGMSSPLAQNERHITVLREVFTEICTPTRLGVQLTPSFCSLVLVSTKARIDRPKKFDTSAIIKADMLTKRLEKDTDSMGVFSAIKSLSKVVAPETLQSIGKQLVERHKPAVFDYARRFGGGNGAEPKSPAPAVAAPQAMQAKGNGGAPVCRACGRDRLSIQYGKYGYYFKCAECEGNTPLKVSCGQPGHKERIRKEGLRFYRECAECGTSTLYFTNSG